MAAQLTCEEVACQIAKYCLVVQVIQGSLVVHNKHTFKWLIEAVFIV